jgi:hypothetical protein
VGSSSSSPLSFHNYRSPTHLSSLPLLSPAAVTSTTALTAALTHPSSSFPALFPSVAVMAFPSAEVTEQWASLHRRLFAIAGQLKALEQAPLSNAILLQQYGSAWEVGQGQGLGLGPGEEAKKAKEGVMVVVVVVVVATMRATKKRGL